MAACFAVAMSSCIDDVVSLERTATVATAYLTWRTLCDLLGWGVPDSKSPPPERSFMVLGIFLDLSGTPTGAFWIMITEQRLEKLCWLIQDYLSRQQLCPGEASSLFGQLSWACVTSHGRAGRSKLRPISRRAHEINRTGMNPQLEAALEWWLDFTASYVPRAISLVGTWTRHVVSYSDGEGSDTGGVGAALWFDPEQPPLAGFLKVPHSLRRLWRTQRSREWRDIFELEAIAPYLVLTHWGEKMRGALWTHYIDNDGALSSLVRGSSSVASGDIIVGRTWRLVSDLQIGPWFERVCSGSNPLDGLSRGRRHGPWQEVIDFVIDADFIAEISAEAGL